MTQRQTTSPADKPKHSYTQPDIRNPQSVPKRWRFEKRDKNILIAFPTYEGMMTSCQVEARFFAPDQPTSNPRSAKRSAETRLQYLFHKGYINRIKINSLGEGRSTIINVLAPAGVDYVTARLGIDRALVNWSPKITKNKPSSHYHSLLVTDVHIVFERVVKMTDLKLKTWTGERALKSKQMQDRIPFLVTETGTSYKKAPDGVFALEYPASEYQDNLVQPVGFFLEVDCGTESNSVWAEKVRAYEQFRQQGLSQQYYGVKNFRVLVTVSSQQRLNNLVETTQRVGGGKGKYYWFTLQSNVDIFRPQLILADIWRGAGWSGKHSLKSLRPDPEESQGSSQLTL
jgi:hypothetical protein